MKQMKFHPLHALLLGSVFLWGACGKPPPEPEPERSADQAVRNLLDGIRRNDPSAIWDFLPDAYQQDANELLHEFARRVSPELWNEAAGTLQRTEKILRTHKETIHRMNLLRELPDPEKNYDRFAGILRTVAESPLANLDHLRTADLGDLLAATGKAVFQELAEISGPDSDFSLSALMNARSDMQEISVQLISEDGDTATLLIIMDGDRFEEPFVRVDGKWVPESLDKEWEQRYRDMRNRIRDITRPDPGAQAALIRSLELLNRQLDLLQQAENPEEFEARFDAALQALPLDFPGNWINRTAVVRAPPGVTLEFAFQEPGMATSIESVFRNRLNAAGIPHIIQQTRPGRIEVKFSPRELWDTESVSKLLQRPGYLELRLVHEDNDALVRELFLSQTSPPGFQPVTLDGMRYFQKDPLFDPPDDWNRQIAETGQISRIYELMLQTTHDPNTGQWIHRPYYVSIRVQIAGDGIQNARPELDHYGRFQVALAFTREGAQRLEAVTRTYAPGGTRNPSNVGRRLAIVVDDTLYSVPAIQTPITGNQAVITGAFTYEEALFLSLILRSGALPAEVRLVGLEDIRPLH